MEEKSCHGSKLNKGFLCAVQTNRSVCPGSGLGSFPVRFLLTYLYFENFNEMPT